MWIDETICSFLKEMIMIRIEIVIGKDIFFLKKKKEARDRNNGQNVTHVRIHPRC